MENRTSHDMTFSEMIADSYNGMRDMWTDMRTLAIGSVLHVLFFLIVPMLVIFGYEVKVLRNATRGRDEVPQFDNWTELIFMGIVSSILAPILYTILPIIGLGLIFYVVAALLSASPTALLSSVVIFAVVTVLAMLLFSYVIFAAIAAYADTGRLSALFDFSLILPVAKSLDYLLAYLLISVILPIVSAIAMTILSATVIGLILVPTLVFLDLVFTFRLVGLVYSKHAP